MNSLPSTKAYVHRFEFVSLVSSPEFWLGHFPSEVTRGGHTAHSRWRPKKSVKRLSPCSSACSTSSKDSHMNFMEA